MSSLEHLFRPFDGAPINPPGENQGDFCITFDAKWRPYLAALFIMLMDEKTWTSGAAVACGEASLLVKELVTGGVCELPTQVRVNPDNGCILEVSYDEGVTWDMFADVSSCGAVGATGATGVQGEPGEQGEQGIQGEPGEQGEQGIQGEQGEQGVPGEPGQSGTTSNPPGDPPGTHGQQLRCAVATGVAAWMIDKFGDALDAFAANFEAVASIEVAISGVIDAIPVVGAFIDAAMDFGREIVEWDIANLKACITEEFEDAVFCALYCELAEDGVISDAIYSSWVSGVASQPLCATGLTLVGQVMSLMMLAIGAQNARNRAYIFASSSNCRIACDECPDTWTFKALGGFHNSDKFTSSAPSDIPSPTVYNSGLDAFVHPGDFFSPCASDNAVGYNIDAAWSASKTITKVKITIEWNSDASGAQGILRAYHGGTEFMHNDISAAGDGEDTFEFNGSFSATNIQFSCDWCGSKGIVKYIEIQGEGTIPPELE